MRYSVLISALFLTTLGCGSVVSDAESMATATCECEDADCAKEAMDGYKGKYTKEDYEALSDEDKKEVDAYLTAAGLCAIGAAMKE